MGACTCVRACVRVFMRVRVRVCVCVCVCMRMCVLATVRACVRENVYITRIAKPYIKHIIISKVWNDVEVGMAPCGNVT